MPAVTAVAETSQPSPAPKNAISQRGKSSRPSPAKTPPAGGASLTAQLADLEAVAADATKREKAARHALERHGGDAAREIAADLVAYRDAIEARKPTATPEAERPAREHELTAAYCEAVKQRGLVLMPVGEGTEVVVVDPSLDAEYQAALAAQIEASRAVAQFRTAHASELEAERRRADADQIRDALAGDDGDAIRRALVPQPTSAAFTTRDLPRRTRGI
jgi:hypothetical protein